VKLTLFPASVVAVCDLDSHAYNSWTTDQQGQRRIWLRNYLGEDLPGCRTMIYGYDSSLSADSRGSERISDYVDGFLNELNKVRKSEAVGFQFSTDSAFSGDRF
jgi:hypothetical protein